MSSILDLIRIEFLQFHIVGGPNFRKIGQCVVELFKHFHSPFFSGEIVAFLGTDLNRSLRRYNRVGQKRKLMYCGL